MKLLHAIRSVNPVGGGPVEGLKQLSMVNRANDHDIEVVSLDAPEDSWVRDFPLPLYALGPAKGKYGYNSGYTNWLKTHRGDYDAVIVDGIWQYHAFGVWQALHDTGTPYVVYPHGMLDPWFKQQYPLKHLKKWLYWPWGDYRVLRDAAAVLFTCEEERLRARESFWLYRCNERVVNFGTAGPVGDPIAQRAEFVARFPKLRDRRLLLFLGRMHEKKGADLLLRAYAQLLQADTGGTLAHYHLVMAGPKDDEYGQELQALTAQLGINERVTWTGMLTGDLKWGALRSAEVFVLPSHQENFGIAVAEALACGVPVLISDKVNIWREVQLDRGGMVDSDTLEGVRRLLQNWVVLSATDRERLRLQAYACFKGRFRIERAAEALIHVLTTCASPPSLATTAEPRPRFAAV